MFIGHNEIILLLFRLIAMITLWFILAISTIKEFGYFGMFYHDWSLYFTTMSFTLLVMLQIMRLNPNAVYMFNRWFLHLIQFNDDELSKTF